jgi:hypothetical protein
MYYERQVPNNLNLNYYPPHSIMNVKVRCHYLLTPHKISGEILVAKDSTGHYFMCPPAGSSTEGEEDSPAPPAPNQPRDRGRSPLRPRWRHARQQASGIFYSPHLAVPLLPLVWPHSLIPGLDLPRCQRQHCQDQLCRSVDPLLHLRPLLQMWHLLQPRDKGQSHNFSAGFQSLRPTLMLSRLSVTKIGLR